MRKIYFANPSLLLMVYTILNNYLTDVKPDKNTSDDTETIKGIFKVGETPVNVVVEIKKQEEAETVRFKAESKYNFEVLPSNCESFNSEVVETYGTTYSIYGHKNAFYLSKKQVIEPDYGLEMICEEVFAILEETVKLFEKKCVNFMNKYVGNEEIHTVDPELKKGVFENKLALVEGDTSLADSFIDKHRSYAKNKLTQLAEKYFSPVVMGPEKDSYFETKLPEGKLRLQLAENSDEIEICLSKRLPEAKGFALVSNAKATYPEYFVTYENGQFILYTFVTPDPYLPKIEEEEIQKLLEAYGVCEQLTVEEEETSGIDSVAYDLRQVMDEQMKDLRVKEKSLDDRERILKDKEKDFYKKVRLFEENKKKQVAVINEKMKSLSDREKELTLQKEDLERQKDDCEREKSQYDAQFGNMTAELKRMRARVDSSGVREDDSIEKKKLEMKIECMIRSRAAMEEQLKKELNNMQEKYRQLLRDIQTRDNEISVMKNDFKIKANQMFQDERDAYEKKIQELQEVANITENDVNIDSFLSYVNEKTEFQGAVIKHAKDKELVSLEHESYLVKIIFGDMFFVDVTKGFKKAVDLKTVSTMNNKYTDIKFFVIDKKTVTARKYFSKHILNPDLAQIIRDLMSNFE